jgi:hypothetical protein
MKPSEPQDPNRAGRPEPKASPGKRPARTKTGIKARLEKVVRHAQPFPGGD